MHVLWVNEAADFVGGCEQYIFNTVRLLRERGVESTLLYDCCKPFSVDFVKPFDHAFPMVDIPSQLPQINPDLIYIHRLSGKKAIQPFVGTGYSAIRFFHDCKLFCPREHRYTYFRHKTCEKRIGLRCYPCLGIINRSEGWPGIRFNFLHTLRSEMRVNMQLDGFVVASLYMAKLMSDHGFSKDTIHVIPLYALDSEIKSSVSCESDLFLFVGQLIRSKGLDTLLQAMALTKHPVRLAIAGAGRQENMFKEIAKKLGLEKRVTFLGRLPHDELITWYDKVSCVVHPARQPESFGLFGLEAMSRGVPVIATAIGGVNAWLKEGKTGLTVPSNDPKSLALAMDKMYESKTLREEMGDDARRRYEDFFRPDKHIEALLNHFEFITNKDN